MKFRIGLYVLHREAQFAVLIRNHVQLNTGSQAQTSSNETLKTKTPGRLLFLQPPSRDL